MPTQRKTILLLRRHPRPAGGSPAGLLGSAEKGQRRPPGAGSLGEGCAGQEEEEEGQEEEGQEEEGSRPAPWTAAPFSTMASGGPEGGGGFARGFPTRDFTGSTGPVPGERAPAGGTAVLGAPSRLTLPSCPARWYHAERVLRGAAAVSSNSPTPRNSP